MDGTELTLEIVTPEREIVTRGVDEVILPSADGYMGIRRGHAPLLARLEVGEITYRADGQDHYLAVTGGFAEVLPSRVAILARACEPADEIDVERAERARERAETAMKSRESDSAFDHASVKLQRAVTRIRVHGRRRG